MPSKAVLRVFGGELNEYVQDMDDEELGKLAEDVKTILLGNAVLNSVTIAELKDVQKAALAELHDRREFLRVLGR